MNECQRELLALLESGHKRILVVKARQLGISTLVRAWHFYKWYNSTEPLKLGVVCHTREAADNLHNTDKTFFNNLPRKLQPICDKSTVRTIRNKTSGAELKAFTAGAQGGTRSYVFSSVHLSEFPFYENPQEALATILAAVGDGQIIIESSPNASGDYFNRLVDESLAGRNEWTTLFFPWTSNSAYAVNGTPSATDAESTALLAAGLTQRQLNWRKKQIGTLGKHKFIREYPLTIEEAFMSGTVTLPYFWTERAAQISPLHLGSTPKRRYPGVTIPNRTFVIGADVSAGVGGDYSALTVLDALSLQPVHHFVSNTVTPLAFAEELIATGVEFNGAKILVEGNSYGASVIEHMQKVGYKNLWRTGTGTHFYTTGISRIRLFEYLKQAIEDNLLLRVDKELLEQIRQCQWTGTRPDHPDGGHDDMLFSLMLAFWCVKGKERWQQPAANMITQWQQRAATKRATVPLPFRPRGMTW